MWRKIFITLSAVLIIVFFIYKIISKINYKAQTEKNIAALPNFKFYNLQNKPFNKDSILGNKNTVILFFNTTCEHCQYETEQIIKNNMQLQTTNVLFVSNQSLKELFEFDSSYHLSQYPLIRVLRDSLNIFYQTFGTSIVPSSFIYGSDGFLKKKFSGEVKFETIINLLK